MMQKKKLLLITECWANGGIESYICGLINRLAFLGIEIHLYATYGQREYHRDLFENYNVKCTILFESTDVPLAKRRYYSEKEVIKKLHNEAFNIVHIHAMNGMELTYLKSAYRENVPIRIAHSHNSSFGKGFALFKNAAHLFGVNRYCAFATDRVACSFESGLYLYGKFNFEVVPNGINIDKFIFNETKRNEIRNRYCIEEECIVIGNIGRIAHAKNPLFLIEILKSCISRNNNVMLLMVGNGKMEEEVIERAIELGVYDKLIRVSTCNNPEDYYSAMDVFIIPSIYEGLPFTCLEAQCSGLTTWVSEAVPDESLITPESHKLSLLYGADKWADLILNSGINTKRKSHVSLLENSAYSDKTCYEPILKMYGVEDC